MDNLPNEQWMRIGEIADFFSVSQKAIRLYEKKGIIKPIYVDRQTSYRYYSATQIQQLNALIELKSMGFSLDEIKDILQGDINSEKLSLALSNKKKAWEEQLISINNKIDAIESTLERVSTTEDISRFSELTEDQRAWLLVRMVCVEDIRAQHTLSEALWL